MDFNIIKIINKLPSADQELMPGVYWGNCDQLFSPAYWKIQYHLHEKSFTDDYYRISSDLVEEICACILGGFGMKAELGMIAFERLRDLDMLQPGISAEEIEFALSRPFRLNEEKSIRYRFPKQKSVYLFDLLNQPDLNTIPSHNDLELRDWLLKVKGIGLKTASWITRNWLKSENVAILDVHILRAGLIAGFIDPAQSVVHDYIEMEKRYLDFSRSLGVNAANLDSLIWLQLKEGNHIAINILKHSLCREEMTTVKSEATRVN